MCLSVTGGFGRVMVVIMYDRGKYEIPTPGH